MVRKIKLKSNHGITLIALVVTIAVLLILAGVSANLLFTDGNILQIAQASVENHKKAQIEEKLSIEIANYRAEKILNPKLNIEDFWQKLVQEGLINSPADITKELIQEENKIVEATNQQRRNIAQTTKIKANGLNIVEQKEKTTLVAKLATTEPIKLVSQDTNQVAQKTQQVVANSKETYTITTKDGYVATVETDGNDNITLKEVLTPNQAKARANTQNPNLITGTITVSAPIWTANENATVTLSTTTGLKMQWQKNSISGMWQEGTTVEGLKHGDTLFTRLIDAEGNAADEASVSILDSIAPEFATITNLPTSTTPGATITANVTHADNQTKINMAKCKWLFNTTSTNLNVNSTDWNTAHTFSTNTNQISIIIPTVPGNYYLHALSVDIAGNKKETISSAIEIISYVGYYADIEGDGTVDGIIYADLAVGGSGEWGNSNGTYSIPKVTTGLKEYAVSTKTYEGQTTSGIYKANEGFGTKQVIAPVAGSSGKERFYIMALDDVKLKNPISSTLNRAYWYYNANGAMKDYNSYTSKSFGSGKENTKKMIAKWKKDNSVVTDATDVDYGAQNEKDLWGQIDAEVAKGWYVPSKEEWSAFAKELKIKGADDTEGLNYANCDLSDWYWSSSQNNTYYVWFASFYGGYMYYYGVYNYYSVRLGATF